MKSGCPNLECKSPHFIQRDGKFWRRCDSRWIQRFRCSRCRRRFSSATSKLEFRQHKRRENFPLFQMLSSGVSMRRCAKLLRLHRTTVGRKFNYLAEKCRRSHSRFLQKYPLVDSLQFDDLITSEHTKLKPLSISLAVDEKNRFILGAEVARIPGFGHLAALSRKKYGKRYNEHPQSMDRLFKKIEKNINPKALIASDEHSIYPEIVRRYFPSATHRRYKGGRGCVTGQGELKKQHYDPLFMLNHTCAMLRANINRLFRRTWCTTKLPSMLKNHLDIYIAYHNSQIK